MAKDVAIVLGYLRTADAVRAHCKAGRPVGVGNSPTLDPQTILIPERDVYRLVMPSKHRLQKLWWMSLPLALTRLSKGTFAVASSSAAIQ